MSDRTFTAASFPPELIASTLHQIRTHISSINGYASILSTGEFGVLAPRQRVPLTRIQELCRSLTNVIGNLLTFARYGAPRSQTGRDFLRVEEIAQQVIRSLQGEVRRRKLRVLLHPPAQLTRFWADPSDLGQIILNLVSNAVKFTPKRGRVDVTVFCQPGLVRIQVSDTGVGIAPRELPRIFEQFYHVDHPEVEATEGSGLGLAIVKRIVDGYQGKITVTSRVGRGSRFQVLLPVRPERQVLLEFLEEAWVQGKEVGRPIGLTFCQLKVGGRQQIESMGVRGRHILESMERALRMHLRPTDRVFRLPHSSLLAVVTMVDPSGFTVMVQRLERAMRETPFVGRLCATHGLRWRLVSMLAPRVSFPTRLFDDAERRLKRAWINE